MPVSDPVPWIEGPAPAERLYLVTGGRTHTEHPLDLHSLVRARPLTSADRPAVPTNHAHKDIVRLCRQAPVSVAEFSARLHYPVQIIKVLVGDLLTTGSVVMAMPDTTADPTDRHLLERVLEGLRK
ncbi:DUF742 domain-containing protein [Streptomyces sp. NPDC102274]|uniref:DUF742 domain-containing protein n=1 Tax=Streptomyces sp. NPDC102274 TaxID=3366151 RepID=UPI00382CF6F7